MTLLGYLLWGLMGAIVLMVLYDFALSAFRHLRWRRRWKADSMSEFHTFRDALDRARSNHPSTQHHRQTRQNR